MKIHQSALVLATKTVLDTNPWQDDCEVVEMPWRDENPKHVRSLNPRPHERDGKLVFGVLKCDGNIRPHPPIQRALTIVTRALLQ